MKLKFRCRRCKATIAIDASHGGRHIKCPACGARTRVPTRSDRDPVAEGSDAPTGGRDMLSALAELERKGSPVGQGLAPAAPAPTTVPQRESPTPANGLPPRIALWGLGAVVLIGLIAIAFGNNITRCFFLLVVVCTISGYWLGASKVAAAFGGLLLGALIGVPLGQALEGAFGAVLGTTGLTNRMISMAVVAVLTAILSSVALRLAIDRAGRKWPAWKPYDRLSGSGFGVLEGMFLGMIVIWAVQWLEPIARQSADASVQVPAGASVEQRSGNPTADLIVALAKDSHDSIVGQVAGAVNPLDHLQLLTLIHKFLVILNDPVVRNAFVSHPSIQGITTYESVQQAMKMMQSDPQLGPIIESGSLSRADVYTIMSNQTILKILDETSLLDDLTPLAHEIEGAIDAALSTVDGGSGGP